MASGASTEPPPLPPADYTPVSTEEWAKKRMPPLRGVIVDPEYPPTAEEALQAIKNHDRNYDSQWQGQQPPADISSRSSPSSPPPQTTSSLSTDNTLPSNPNRSSGSSKIFGRVAGDSSAPVSNNITATGSDNTSTTTTPTTTSSAAAATPLPPKWQQKNPSEVTTWDILTSLGPRDFGSVLAQPCFRETFMYALLSGVLAAGALWTVGKPRRWIVNGGFGSTTLVYAGVFPYCMAQRRSERQNTMLVKETWEETRAEKRKVWEAYKERKKVEDEARAREKSGGGLLLSRGSTAVAADQQNGRARTGTRWWSGVWGDVANAESRGREG